MHLVHVNCRGDELLVVNQSIAICISLEKFEVQMNFDEKPVLQWNRVIDSSLKSEDSLLA